PIVRLPIPFTSHFRSAFTDANQLENAILNLAINARDAMPQGGKLTIETTNLTLAETDLRQGEGLQPGSYVVIAVSDTGIGMSQRSEEHTSELQSRENL